MKLQNHTNHTTFYKLQNKTTIEGGREYKYRFIENTVVYRGLRGFNARYQAGTLPLIFNAFSAAARTACNPSESILTGRTTITHKKGPIAGQKCYKIFDTSNILLSRELGRTKKNKMIKI